MASYQASRRVAFMVTHAFMSNSLDLDPQVELDRARDGGLQSSKGTLIDETRPTIGGMPARRIVMDIPQGRAVPLGVIGGNRLYRVIAVVPAGWEEAPDVRRFLNSFALVSP